MINETVVLALLGCLSAVAVIVCLWIRESPSPARRMLMFGFVALAIEAVLHVLGELALLPDEIVRWQLPAITARSATSIAIALFTLTYARVNYRVFLRAWSWPMVIVSAVVLVFTALNWNGILVGISMAEDRIAWRMYLGRTGVFVLAFQLVFAVIGLMNLERTLRAAVGTLRWKIKFIALGVGTVLAAQVYTTSQSLLLGRIEPFLGAVNMAALTLGGILISISLLRANLSGVDLYISTRLIYRSLTAVLVGVYLTLVGVTSKLLFRPDTRPASVPMKTLIVFAALTALGVILLSDRVRQQVKRVLSRHLQRPEYDHRLIRATMTDRTSKASGLAAFCRDTAHWMSETFEILSVTIWSIDEPRARLTFGGSTRGYDSKTESANYSGPAVRTLIEGLRSSEDLADLRAIGGEWADQINTLSPDSFDKGGPRVCLPLRAGSDLVGMMVMSDRVQSVPFSSEELDLFRTIASHIASRLYVYRLSEQVIQAKQMEAFQAMSAFFVHDLKNTASTLSLMLQNLSTHFDDPAFRSDALRAVAKSVEKINGLIARLAFFRQSLEMRKGAADLNAVVTSALAEASLPAGIRLQRALAPLPPIYIDAEQIKNAVLNLLFNARDAGGPEGEISVRTERRGDDVLLTVADNGCGMSADFIQQSLFKPFKTTKPQGIGIGLFHTKVVVEANDGRIEVDSEPGKGSRFRMLFSVKGDTSEPETAHRG